MATKTTKPTKATPKAPAKTATKAAPDKATKQKVAKAPKEPAVKITKLPSNKKAVFVDAVQKKPKPKKPTITNKKIIGDMADAITATLR